MPSICVPLQKPGSIIVEEVCLTSPSGAAAGDNAAAEAAAGSICLTPRATSGDTGSTVNENVNAMCINIASQIQGDE